MSINKYLKPIFRFFFAGMGIFSFLLFILFLHIDYTLIGFKKLIFLLIVVSFFFSLIAVYLNRKILIQ